MAIGKEIFNGTTSLDDPYTRIENALINGLNILEGHIKDQVDNQIREKLKDWEPTQNIKLTVEVVDGKDH